MGHSPEVKCVVNTCNHWIPGNLCTASNIDILNEEEGKMSEIAEQTECKTFYKRDGLADMIGAADNVNWTGMATALFKDGIQITPTVTCVVDSCKYWDKGNLCGADSIEVTGRNANECQDTNCETFRPRT